MAGAMRGMPDGSAGLPRRCAPRNDKGEDGNGRGGFRPAFRMRPTTLSLRARQGVAIRSPHCYVIARKVSKRTDVAIQSEALCGRPGRCGGMPNGSAGLPCRGFAPSRNDNGGKPTTLGLRLLGLARLRLGPRPASLSPVLSARPSSFRPPYWLAGRRLRRKPRRLMLKAGPFLSRNAERAVYAESPQEPPR
jgi:hypothetical protein